MLARSLHIASRCPSCRIKRSRGIKERSNTDFCVHTVPKPAESPAKLHIEKRSPDEFAAAAITVSRVLQLLQKDVIAGKMRGSTKVAALLEVF